MTRASFFVAAVACAQTPYQYYLTGNPADVHTPSKPGFALVGGGKDQDAVMRWFLERSGGGDVVVLRASGADGYNGYLNGLGKVDSIESIVINTPEAARDPFVARKIRTAEALFIAGGDQWNYVRLWRGSPVGEAVPDGRGQARPSLSTGTTPSSRTTLANLPKPQATVVRGQRRSTRFIEIPTVWSMSPGNAGGGSKRRRVPSNAPSHNPVATAGALRTSG
jgi:hypothetical protein